MAREPARLISHRIPHRISPPSFPHLDHRGCSGAPEYQLPAHRRDTGRLHGILVAGTIWRGAIQMAAVGIGKIVGSESHVRYTCQIFGPGEVAAPPDPSAYAFGGFVRLPLRTALAAPDVAALETRPGVAMR